MIIFEIQTGLAVEGCGTLLKTGNHGKTGG
jgi:hypothetical protein